MVQEPQLGQQMDLLVKCSRHGFVHVMVTNTNQGNTWTSAKVAEFYVSFTPATNNTGEMQGMIEATVLAEYLCGTGSGTDRQYSLHIKELVGDKFVARENRVFATLPRSDKKEVTTTHSLCVWPHV